MCYSGTMLGFRLLRGAHSAVFALTNSCPSILPNYRLAYNLAYVSAASRGYQATTLRQIRGVAKCNAPHWTFNLSLYCRPAGFRHASRGHCGERLSLLAQCVALIALRILGVALCPHPVLRRVFNICNAIPDLVGSHLCTLRHKSPLAPQERPRM